MKGTKKIVRGTGKGHVGTARGHSLSRLNLGGSWCGGEPDVAREETQASSSSHHR